MNIFLMVSNAANALEVFQYVFLFEIMMSIFAQILGLDHWFQLQILQSVANIIDFAFDHV